MASLLNICRFTAGSSGTTDFLDGTADTGFRNLNDAGAADAGVYPYRAENATRTEWEIGYGTYSTSNGALERTTVVASSNSDAAVNFASAPTVMITPLTADIGPHDIRQESHSADYTTTLFDANKHLLHPSADNNARTFTIDSNANVPYPIGTVLTFVNEVNTLSIAIASDTLTLAGPGTTGTRSLAANGIATALKVGTTSWLISGVGLT